MSKEHIIAMDNVSPKPSKSDLDMNVVEMVFGTPNSPKTGLNTTQHDTHRIDNESRLEGDTQSHHRKESDAQAQPLLESPLPRPQPPIAGPEIDDLDDEKPPDSSPYPGIDDGFLEPGVHTNSTPELDDGSTTKVNGTTDPHLHDEGVGTEDGKWAISKHGFDEPDFYYGGGLESRFGEDDRPGSPMPTIPGSIPDVNTYQQKKNLAQGMMDLALLSANANQLRYVLESSEAHPYYYFSLVFIAFSIICQVLVGIGLIMNSRYNVKNEKDICKADKINNMTVLGIFLITIVNVFITSFSVASPTVTAVAPVVNGG